MAAGSGRVELGLKPRAPDSLSDFGMLLQALWRITRDGSSLFAQLDIGFTEPTYTKVSGFPTSDSRKQPRK